MTGAVTMACAGWVPDVPWGTKSNNLMIQVPDLLLHARFLKTYNIINKK